MKNYLKVNKKLVFIFLVILSFKGLLILSKNDIIKDVIIKSNQLNFLIDLADAYSIIYEIVWSLSFDIRIQEQLRLNRIFINKLENNCTNEQMTKILHGIQWNLNPDDTRNKTKNNNSEKFDIIISYSHKDKLICTQIYNELIQNNYHVWIDFNEIHENIMDGMVQGIEQSRIIILCMSEEYKRNNYCRAEAQYAFQKKLKIIPILIEKYYKPDGWLLFLIGSLVYIDFTKYQFSHAVQLLLNQLKTPQISVIDSLVVRQQPQNITNLPISTLGSTDMRQWTQNDVQKWFKDNNLVHMGQILSDLNGLNLIYLSKLISNNSPQENLILFQEDSMNKTGRNVSLIEIARLHDLIEEQVRVPVPVQPKKWSCKNCCRMM